MSLSQPDFTPHRLKKILVDLSNWQKQTWHFWHEPEHATWKIFSQLHGPGMMRSLRQGRIFHSFDALLKFECSRLKSHLLIQSIQIYRCELQFGCKTPHFNVEIHDIIELSIASSLLLKQLFVNVM